MNTNFIKISLHLFLCIFFYHTSFGQSEGGKPDYQVPIVKPLIKDYVNFVKRDCEDQLDFYDVYVDIDIIPGRYKKEGTIITPSRVFLYPINNIENGIWIQEDMEAELFNVKSTDGYIRLKAKAYDQDEVLWVTKDIIVPTKKDGMVRTSKRLHDALEEWREASEIQDEGGEDANNGLNSGDVPGFAPGFGKDVLTFFCGRYISKLELLIFYSEYLDLTSAQLCRFRELYAEVTSSIWSINTGRIEWDEELCELLKLYWEEFTSTDGTAGGTGIQECNCKIIKSSTYVRHSVGAEIGIAGESNEEVTCPDVSAPDEDDLWWGKNAPPGWRTDHQNNWANILWGWQGAAKMVHLHVNQEDGGSGMPNPNIEFGKNGETSSSLSFSMFCYDPITLGPAFNEDCSCSKVVSVGYYYGANFHGGANTTGTGKIKALISDIAAFVMVSSDGSSDSSAFAISTVEINCESTDTTTQVEDITNFLTGLQSAATGVNLSDIAGTITTAADLYNLGTAIFESFACGESVEKSDLLLSGKTQITLTPENYSSSFIIYSYVEAEVFTENSDAFLDLTLNTDYYLAGTLYTDAESDTAYCCQELVGSYAIGDLSAFTNDNLGQPKFNDLFDSPLNMGDKQNRVATCILNTGGTAFGIVVFPGIGCCQPKIDCYYDCQYFGTCHGEEGETNQESGHESSNRNFHLNIENSVRLFPSPLEKGNYLSIENLKGHEDLQSIEILNSQGQLFREITNMATANNVIELDLSNISSGIYFVRYNNASGSVTNKIMIK